MQNPAVWNADPECGHRVAHAYQTHYCTYIRVPRLLTLQDSNSSDERFLITALQWYELWFKVLLTDLRAALREDGSTFEPIKLLRRGVELYKLFFLHADLCDAIITRDLALKKSLRDATGRGISNSFAEILILAGQLARRWRNPPVELVEAVREYRAQLDAFRARYEKFLRATLIRKPRAPTYANWLHVNQLLGLQGGIKSAWTEEGKSPHGFRAPAEIGADETMFIVVHQCFEVWFRVLLDCIERAIPLLQRGEIRAATRGMRRVERAREKFSSRVSRPRAAPRVTSFAKSKSCAVCATTRRFSIF
ncbi:MAG: hypothetical protein HY070_06375 [Chloroflexi bacterium]|nr:hypothetical protein [Chloroflexota bacterium]